VNASLPSKAILADLLLGDETKDVPFGSEDKTITIRKLKTKHLAKIMKQVPEAEKAPLDFAQAMVAAGLVEPTLTIEQVGELDLKLLTTISNEITKFSGFTEEEIERARGFPTPEKGTQSGT